ncbi:MAG: YceH family protein, partial [Gammaproteobacteria bacterium]|nr:YceH family protein [Gammaproteobacteria bacterium]
GINITMFDFNNTPLNPEQIRVLGCLMEKHLATPSNYPLTPNSLTLACNQKSNRHPVMQMDEGKVVNVATQLNQLELVSIQRGERIDKFSHRAPGAFEITREEQGVLSILMLREPLTLSDIKARTEKTVGFESLSAVKEVVDSMISRSPALLVELPLFTGQREERYTHLLAGQPDLSDVSFKPSKSSSPSAVSGSAAAKLEELEQRIARLEKALDMQWQADESLEEGSS